METKLERNKRALAAVTQLKKLIAAKGLAQADVAARLRVPLGSVNRWVNDRHVPRSSLVIESIEGFLKNPNKGA